MTDRPKLLALLTAINGWLMNDEGLMIDDVVEWRTTLAAALHWPGCPVRTDTSRWDAPCTCPVDRGDA